MTKKLIIDGATGAISITNSDDGGFYQHQNAHDDPYNNLEDVQFHSSLQYLRLVEVVEPTATITLPAIPRDYYTWSSSSGGGLCYITTACVKALNLPDDCDELQTLRKFRDEYMLADPERATLVAEYYDSAPEIVEKLNKLPASEGLYREIFNEFIVTSVDAIKQGDNERALELYKEGVATCKKIAEEADATERNNQRIY